MGSKRFLRNSSKSPSPGVGVANRQARGEDHAVTIVSAKYHTNVRRDVQLQIATKACAPYDLTLNGDFTSRALRMRCTNSEQQREQLVDSRGKQTMLNCIWKCAAKEEGRRKERSGDCDVRG